MKYMTFNSSCSYAALANLLSLRGLDTTDRQIALDMGLPFLFAKEDGAYLAGPMLQGKRWFDLYLVPRGWTLIEQAVPRESLCAYLRAAFPAMMGLHVRENSKHAVIFVGFENDLYLFFNNKWQTSDEPETLLLAEPELLSRAGDPTTVGVLADTAPKAVDMAPLYASSAAALRSLETDVRTFCAQARTPHELRQAMDPLFRALLVDAVTMMELLGETAIYGELKILQAQFMAAVRKGRTLCPADVLDLSLLAEAVQAYITLIHSKENP